MPSRHRGALAVAGLAAAAATLAGCKATQQEVVVQFALGATPAQHDEVRRGCNVPGVVTEPKPSDTLASDRVNDLRYDVTKATLQQRRDLFDCLRRYRQVLGAQEPEKQ